MNRYLKANIAFSKFSRDYSLLKKSLPIRPSEMGVLNIITRREEMFTPVMIAELLGVSKPMIAAHISSLEKQGYVYRESSLNDKRSFFVMPTDKAEELVAKAEEELEKQLKVIENRLGKERFDLLVSLLEQTQDALEPGCDN